MTALLLFSSYQLFLIDCGEDMLGQQAIGQLVPAARLQRSHTREKGSRSEMFAFFLNREEKIERDQNYQSHRLFQWAKLELHNLNVVLYFDTG